MIGAAFCVVILAGWLRAFLRLLRRHDGPDLLAGEFARLCDSVKL